MYLTMKSRICMYGISTVAGARSLYRALLKVINTVKHTLIFLNFSGHLQSAGRHALASGQIYNDFPHWAVQRS